MLRVARQPPEHRSGPTLLTRPERPARKTRLAALRWWSQFRDEPIERYLYIAAGWLAHDTHSRLTSIVWSYSFVIADAERV